MLPQDAAEPVPSVIPPDAVQTATGAAKETLAVSPARPVATVEDAVIQGNGFRKRVPLLRSPF